MLYAVWSMPNFIWTLWLFGDEPVLAFVNENLFVNSHERMHFVEGPKEIWHYQFYLGFDFAS